MSNSTHQIEHSFSLTNACTGDSFVEKTNYHEVLSFTITDHLFP